MNDVYDCGNPNRIQGQFERKDEEKGKVCDWRADGWYIITFILPANA